MRKQILILEELGVPHNAFVENAASAGLDYDIVRENPNPDSVEIIINPKSESLRKNHLNL